MRHLSKPCRFHRLRGRAARRGVGGRGRPGRAGRAEHCRNHVNSRRRSGLGQRCWQRGAVARRGRGVVQGHLGGGLLGQLQWPRLAGPALERLEMVQGRQPGSRCRLRRAVVTDIWRTDPGPGKRFTEPLAPCATTSPAAGMRTTPASPRPRLPTPT
jgi:hypothetical protein